MTRCFQNTIFEEACAEKHYDAYREGYSVTVHNDDGVEESLRRSREMDEDPAMSITEEEFFASFEKYRTR